MTRQLIPTQTYSPTWDLAVETMRGFAPFFQERTIAAMRQAPPHWFTIVIAAANDPRPLTVEQLHASFPYNQPRQLQEILQPIIEAGYLQATSASGNAANGDDSSAAAYRVTPAGRALIKGFYDAAHEGLRDFAPLPSSDLQALRDLLQTIVHAIQSPLPAHESVFHTGRASDPGPGASLAAQIDQYVTDLYYFRDDAHIASWRATGLDGIAFEALTLIWREQADSAAALNEQLANRRLSTDDYAAALQRLAARDLVAIEDERAALTAAGRRLRQEVEARTDDIFFAPWQALDAAQLDNLHALLEELRDAQQHAARLRMWPLMNDVAAAMQPLVQHAVNAVMQAQLETPVLFNQLRMAREAQPQLHTVERVLTRFPYMNPQRPAGFLQQAVDAGYMLQDGDHYTLTAEGEAVVDAVNDAFYQALAAIEALPDEQMDCLNELLRRLVEAVLQSAAPSTDRLRQTYDSAQPRDYAPLARVDLNIDDLNAFRDDAHTSAWAAHFASGRDWETLTLVWRDQAHTAAELAAQLPFRGWDEAAYQASLDNLVQRGWLQQENGAYTVTPTGDDLRRRVEQDTDNFFYAAWDQALSPQEETELRTLLIRLKVQLEALHQPQESTA